MFSSLYLGGGEYLLSLQHFMSFWKVEWFVPASLGQKPWSEVSTECSETQHTLPCLFGRMRKTLEEDSPINHLGVIGYASSSLRLMEGNETCAPDTVCLCCEPWTLLTLTASLLITSALPRAWGLKWGCEHSFQSGFLIWSMSVLKKNWVLCVWTSHSQRCWELKQLLKIKPLMPCSGWHQEGNLGSWAEQVSWTQSLSVGSSLAVGWAWEVLLSAALTAFLSWMFVKSPCGITQWALYEYLEKLPLFLGTPEPTRLPTWQCLLVTSDRWGHCFFFFFLLVLQRARPWGMRNCLLDFDSTTISNRNLTSWKVSSRSPKQVIGSVCAHFFQEFNLIHSCRVC